MRVHATVKDTDHGWKALMDLPNRIRDSYAKVGVLADADGGGLHEEGNLTVAEIAAVLEYGTEDGRIPSRPFLRHTFDAERENLIGTAKKLLPLIYVNKMTVEKALGIMGLQLATATKRYITDTPGGVPPPNAPSTLARKQAKGHNGAATRTLIDSGRMVNSITWTVISHGGGE